MLRTIVTNTKMLLTGANIAVPMFGSIWINRLNAPAPSANCPADLAAVFDFAVGMMIGQFAYSCATRDADLRLPGMLSAFLLILIYTLFRAFGVYNGWVIFGLNSASIALFATFLILDRSP